MKILTEHGEAELIARVFGVSGRTVRDALKFRTNSDLAKKIRHYAVQRGGVETQSKPKQNLS